MNRVFFRLVGWSMAASLLAISVYVPSLGAQTIFAPMPKLEAGEIDGGLAISPYRRKIHSSSGGSSASLDYSRDTVFANYGLPDKANLHFELSNVDLGSLRGLELATGYYGRLGQPTTLGSRRMNKGYFGIARYANLAMKGINGTLLQIDAGAGATVAFDKRFSAYGSVLLSWISGDIDGNGFGAEDPLGIVGGGFVKLDPAIMLGGEIHLWYESGISLYGSMGF